jgi:hypothetical protein
VCKPKITIVDERGEAAAASFLRDNPRFREFCDLRILTLSARDPAFASLDFLDSGSVADRTSVVFCLPDEKVTMTALSAVLDMVRTCGKKVARIYLRLARPERLGGFISKMQALSRDEPLLIPFAPDSEVFSADVLLNRSLDTLARGVHEAYLAVEQADRRANNQPSAAGKTWDELSEDDRQGNRETADHLWAKMRALGYSLREAPRDGAVQPICPDLLTQLGRHEEELARAEHYRWMTWRLLCGWSPGAQRDNVRMIHPDIRDYDELAEPTKEKDRAIVRAIPKLATDGHLAIHQQSDRPGLAEA